MKRLLLASAFLGLAGALGSANAALIVPTTLSLWTADTPGSNSGSATQQALPSARGALATATNPFVVINEAYTTPINFSESGTSPGTINGFAPGSCVGACPNGNISGTLGTFYHATLFEFTFTLASSATLSVLHDDGASVFLDSGGGNAPVGSNLFTDPTSSQPTFSRTDTTGTLAAGTYDLFYTAANGLPEVLNAQFTPVTAPEPASLTLIGSALVGLGWLSRRRRKTA